MVFTFWGTAKGQVRINEVRADDDGSDESEFIELIGIAGTDLTDYQIVHYNGASSSDTDIFTHTIGSFTLPDDGITDTNANSLGFYVLGTASFTTGTDEFISDALQNGPDGIVLYDDEGNIIDAVAWEGEGDLTDDDPGTVTTSGTPEADNYLHVTIDDDSGDNSLQAPNDVVGDNGSGWTLAAATIGSINIGQTSGSVIINSSIKAEPASHVFSFSATGSINSVDLSWIDATGSPAPDAYLVKVSDTDFSSISVPNDTSPEADDTDISDGSGALNINYGVESVSFSGLDETSTYYFKIYPYTNTGSDIDYKTDGTVPQDDATSLETPDIVLNEILSDPDGDTNGDGTTNSDDDEFLEFVNTGSSDLDISNWTIEDGSGTTHTFENPTVLKPLQAVVVFGGGTPTGDFGGSIIQTTGSLSLNNGGDDVILKNNSGVEIFNIHYSGATDQSETRSPDLTGNFTNHTTADPKGTSFSPGTRIDGFSFHPRVSLSGSEGWRMLSSPTSDNSYDDLLHNLWTQGIATGADWAGGSPNVLTYDGSSFSAVGNLNSTMKKAQGFLVFVYEDDDFNPGTSESFPKTLEMFGTPNTGSVTPVLNSGSETATLLGNPFLVPIDWDNLSKTDLSGTVYVYDHSYGTPSSGNDAEAAGIAGSYRSWNGTAGSLTDGKIAPLQGFWVINSSGSPSPVLTIEEADQTLGGSFYKDEISPPMFIRLKAETENMFNEAYLSFTEQGLEGMDNDDGLELPPLDHGSYISLATDVEGIQMDINNLPAKIEQPIEIPLNVQAFETIESGWIQKNGEIILSWPDLNHIPDEWTLTLRDTQTDKIINLRESISYTFKIQASAQKIINKTPFSMLIPKPVRREKSLLNNRFILTINPVKNNRNVQYDIPDHFALDQNYPNPFNPTTNIKYELAELGEVELSVYNVMGQQVATLVNAAKAPGAYEVTWDASEMASGIYYYRLYANGVVFNRQMTLIK